MRGAGLGMGGGSPALASGGRGGGGRARSGSESGHGLFSGSWIRRGALGCATGREAFDLLDGLGYLVILVSYTASCVMRHAYPVHKCVLYCTVHRDIESIPYL